MVLNIMNICEAKESSEKSMFKQGSACEFWGEISSGACMLGRVHFLETVLIGDRIRKSTRDRGVLLSSPKVVIS